MSEYLHEDTFVLVDMHGNCWIIAGDGTVPIPEEFASQGCVKAARFQEYNTGAEKCDECNKDPLHFHTAGVMFFTEEEWRQYSRIHSPRWDCIIRGKGVDSREFRLGADVAIVSNERLCAAMCGMLAMIAATEQWKEEDDG